MTGPPKCGNHQEGNGFEMDTQDGIEERMRRKTRPCACAARHALSHLSHTRPPGREPRHLPTSAGRRRETAEDPLRSSLPPPAGPAGTAFRQHWDSMIAATCASAGTDSNPPSPSGRSDIHATPVAVRSAELYMPSSRFGALVAREFVCLTLDSQGSEATELSRRAFSVRSRAGRGGSARQSSSSTSTSVRKPPWPKADSPRVPAAPLPVLPSGPALPRRRPRSPPPAPPLLFSSS